MICQKGCFEVFLAACEETIILTGLASSQSYFWLITTKNNKVYQKQTTSDNTGKLTIDTTILPPGSFSIYAILKLELRLGSNYLTKIQFTFDSVPYECIQMRFQDIQGDSEGANVIGLNEYLPVPGARYLEDVFEGDGISIDKTDPKNPIISATGAGSGGVTKAYVDAADQLLQQHIDGLTTDDIAETANRVYLTPAELVFLQQLKANYES